jgi:acyl carrier protein
MNNDVTRIVDIIKRIGDLETLEPDQDFYRAGVDSMKALDVMLELETEFDITVPDDRFVQARTAEDLSGLVAQLRSE